MGEIPEDIMKAAIKVGRAALRNLDQDDVSMEVGIIARALMARDERAAKIADDWRLSISDGYYPAEFIEEIGNTVGPNIAIAIRGGN